MRFAIIFGRTHDNKVVVAAGPGNPEELNRDFKKVALEKEHDDYAELFLHEIYLSQGRKRAAFVDPASMIDDGLYGLTVPKLRELGEDEGVDITGCKVKKEYLARIRAYRSLNEKTIVQLKQFASEQSPPIDVSECEHKKDFVNTIAAAQRERDPNQHNEG